MEEQFEVFLGNCVVGKVQLIRQGLYFRVVCRCQLPGKDVYRLYVCQDNGLENLGVPVPEGDGFLLDKKVTAKRFGNSRIRFVVSAGVPTMSVKFQPISPEEPFCYIDRLKNAFLECQNGRIGIRIAEHPETG